MDVSIEKTSPCNYKLSVTVPAADVKTAFDAVYRQIGKQARIPGFRPGRAPRNVLDLHHGREIRGEVTERLVSQSLRQAIEEHDVQAVAPPTIATEKLAKGADFLFTAVVEVRPEIELKQYTGLHAKRYTSTVEDKEIEAELQKLREQSAQLVPVSTRDVVEKGDLVQVDYEGFAEDGTAIEGAKSENAMIEVGGAEYLPGLSEGLQGAKVPGEVDAPVTFPEDYSAEHLRGVKATFRLKTKEIKAKEYPELDDDFAKDLGLESFEGLRQQVRDRLAEANKREADQKQRVSILEALVEANPFEAPPSMISDQADRMIEDAAMRFQYLMGQQVDPTQLDLEGLKERNLPAAEFQVKSGLLLLEVAKKESLEVSDEELQEELDRLSAAQKGRSLSEEVKSSTSFRLLEEKTLKFLTDAAVLTEASDEEGTSKEEDQAAAAGSPEGDSTDDAESAERPGEEA